MTKRQQRGSRKLSSKARPKRDPKKSRGIRRLALPPWIVCALILTAAIVIHAESLTAPFFSDDYLFLDQVRDRSLPETLTSPDPLGNFFRPVGRQLYFWSLANLGGESPLVFHMANLALYLLVLALLYLLTRRLAGNLAGIAAAAMLALHYAADIPIRWSSGSQDLVAVAGALGALLLYLYGRGMLASVVLLLGLLSKETVVFTPLIAVLLGRGQGATWFNSFKRALHPAQSTTSRWRACTNFAPRIMSKSAE